MEGELGRGKPAGPAALPPAGVGVIGIAVVGAQVVRSQNFLRGRLLELHVDPDGPAKDAGVIVDSPAPQLGRHVGRRMGDQQLGKILLLKTKAPQLGVPVGEFLALAEEYAAMQEARAAYLARCASEVAARNFIRIVETCDRPETCRKAAGAIVRMSSGGSPKPASTDMRIRGAVALINAKPTAGKETLDRLAELVDAPARRQAPPAPNAGRSSPPAVRAAA